jgi:phosphohistidine phosphatase
VLTLARRAGAAPQIILTSPLMRAKQTADLAAKAFRHVKIKETRALLPSANPELLWKEIAAMREVEKVMVAGHEPHLSNFIRFILESAVSIDLKKGGLVRVSTPNHVSPPRGILKWMITPRLAREN